MHRGSVLKLEYAQPPAAVETSGAMNGLGAYLRAMLICKSNEAPEIESYGARPQVSRPAGLQTHDCSSVLAAVTRKKKEEESESPWF